ncbi:hypothetical protein H2198_004207 [Neophaeococcomyces mojaviensis]|uniref:Uncharacterized protein n=1 Tax=Neophaeococcomyces mojaviensis TaxID=3383035 RepID=A0ACC3A972_9EURO|nr:hypothetical protein H2198_004207 [Knufia sp. JES_112]
MQGWYKISSCGNRSLRRRHALNVHFSISRSITQVASLKTWDIDEFRQQAFNSQIPICLPASVANTPSACTKWFIHETDEKSDDAWGKHPVSKLNPSFWQQHASAIVPLEITSVDSENKLSTKFERVDAPFDLLLRYVDDRSSPSTSIYLAQHDLRDLPESLQGDLPIPDLVRTAGRGDLYSSSLWLGKAPTYTPLHRDPNPNFFMQLVGTKVIRLFRPDIGSAIFEHVQLSINASHQEGYTQTPKSGVSGAFRGEEMMQGVERALLHDLIWAESSWSAHHESIQLHAQEAILGLGQAIFIPKGWWHTVKGVGGGVTASANWWFR